MYLLKQAQGSPIKKVAEVIWRSNRSKIISKDQIEETIAYLKNYNSAPSEVKNKHKLPQDLPFATESVLINYLKELYALGD